MKKLITLTVMCMVAVAAVAQEQADIEVSYNIRNFYANGKEIKQNYHLLANPGYSKYFSPKSERIDSITSTPEGMANYKQIQMAAMQAMIAQGKIDMSKMPNKTENIYVIKSASDTTMTVYDMLGEEKVYYKEHFSEMTWEIGDSVKMILGYECVQATTDYHGRTWKVWFAPAIPISDGPWKFRGLPGLIMEASLPNGIGMFAVGIEMTDKMIGKVYGADKYEKMDRKEILRARRAVVDNPVGVLSAKGLLKGVKIGPMTFSNNNDKFDFIETDYR